MHVLWSQSTAALA